MEKGIESLIADVKRDCEEGCFNINGCNHEFYRYEPETRPYMIKAGFTSPICRRISKCTHKYCDKLVWVLNRAEEYAEYTGTTRYEVLKAWEEERTYWYMNYYQECNQPSPKENGFMKFSDWKAKLIERFGENPENWKFKCPVCGHVQSMKDFKDIGKDINLAYYNCIGRYDKEKGGCDYTSGGLFCLNKNTIVGPNAVPIRVFEMADK